MTYFPLTWKFAHDTFGWEYVWDKSKGLIIKSNNPQVKTVNLPKYAGENNVAVFDGYYYFVETVNKTNKVYRAKDSNISNKELVYSYEIDTNYGFNNSLTFYKADKTLWFYYHSGGAVMGRDVYCKVNDEGKATVEESGYLDFKNTSNGTLKMYQGPPPNGANFFLSSKEGGIDKEKSIGNPNLIYRWNIQEGYNSDKSTTVINDKVYYVKDGRAAYPASLITT
ncbi:hypothetical protein [Tepidibacter sp. Z1-5]|uniref:hypothetical protein n=1 Tax=Tepidibacter sp. Z1-5 TaxID=3134138 RepID=UPI0030BD211C